MNEIIYEIQKPVVVFFAANCELTNGELTVKGNLTAS